MSSKINYFKNSHLNKVIILLLMSFLVVSCVKKVDAPFNKKILTINSSVFNESRDIYLQLPKSLNHLDAHHRKYPLIIVLDGDQYFGYVSGLVDILSTKGYMPEALVVAIPPVNRNWELTPFIKGDPNSGGADKLIEFLDQELFPYLYKHYPLLDHKTIVGHSFGGLWGLYCLFNHSQLFDYYLTSDPSFTEYHNKYATLKLNYQDPKRLFLAIANTLTEGSDTLDLKSGGNQQHIADLFYLRDKVIQSNSKDLIMDWRYYPNNSHSSVMVPAFKDGLESLFSWFPMDKQAVSMVRNPSLTDEQLLSNLESYIEKLKTELGPEAKPNETQFYDIIRLVPAKKEQLTLKLLLLTQKYYPNSFNSNQALGIFFYNLKEPEKAAYFLRKALDIRSDSLTLTMLKELKS